ncbi:LOW QUALITY PROTEIN: hypothetical protein CVT26_011417 [Gymnopilus dilepis]|uniref:Uncharacterized protein n=1 Tax=Gymnopilus dilepis TaxID=231916 RepID=A0A409W8W9_9AGAR|nr:LOW QUALITY PROTEIN: hypothetical protein CVT26_011417 [Gymnopilus dilepis]
MSQMRMNPKIARVTFTTASQCWTHQGQIGVSEVRRQGQQKDDQEPWYPFETREEWQVAHWIMSFRVDQAKTNDFLKLSPIRNLIFGEEKSAYLHSRQRIDALLRSEGPKWTYVHYYRNPIECIKELITNSAFRVIMAYSPHVAEAMNCRAGASRWITDHLCSDVNYNLLALLPDGTAVVPIILSSDKTNLTRFNGDKQAWSVYLSIGNISKSTRRKTSSHAMRGRSDEGCCFFHCCMRTHLASLSEAGWNVVDLTCADGFIRTIFFILAAYITDHPEQCLVACCKENACPTCTVDPDDSGKYRVHSVLRDHEKTIDILEDRANGNAPEEFNNKSIRLVDPFRGTCPNATYLHLLHQLRKGLLKGHIVTWATEACNGGEDEIDERQLTLACTVSRKASP